MFVVLYTVCAAPEYCTVAPGLLNVTLLMPVDDKPDSAVEFASCKVAVVAGITTRLDVLVEVFVV